MNDYFGEIHDRVVAGELAENRAMLDMLFPGVDMASRLVLDVGCGRGGWSLAFAERHPQLVVGLDLSRSSLETAESLRQGAPVHFACSRMENLPIADCAADIVFCWGSLHYADSPEIALKELLRVCSDSGESWIMGHAATSFTWLHDLIRRFVNLLPHSCRWCLLDGCAIVLHTVGRAANIRRFHGSHSVRQKLAERWFYPGALHSLRTTDLIAWARSYGWNGQAISLDYPNRHNPSNSILLRFRKIKTPS
ncbi:MAG: methyltransferase domain-containing protein [Verrucomicrobia bacterium]|nr:methyltransferase domain-containing protein [Verrucomicrobiota bacterium]